MGIVVVLLLTLLVAGAPAPADATGIRITVTSPVPHRRPNDIHHGPVGDHIGYWAYSWVPQSYVSNVWVPGTYNSDALWVEGHYEPRAYTWG